MELIELMERLPAGTRISPEAAREVSRRSDLIDAEVVVEIARMIEPDAGDVPAIISIDISTAILNVQNRRRQNVGVEDGQARRR